MLSNQRGRKAPADTKAVRVRANERRRASFASTELFILPPSSNSRVQSDDALNSSIVHMKISVFVLYFGHSMMDGFYVL